MLRVRIYYGVLIAGFICFYFLYSDYISFVVLTIFLLLPIFLWIINLIATKHVKVSLKMRGNISEQFVGIPTKITIDNESVFPIGEAKIDLFSSNQFSKDTFCHSISVPVTADNVTVIKTDLISNHVGKIEIKANKIKYYDILKLTTITKKLTISENYYVLPPSEKIYLDMRDKDAIDEESNTYSEKKANVNHSDILDYHEYAQGDSIKKINWKLSSRLNELMVKEFAEPISHAALILYELASSPQKAVTLNQIDLSLQTVCSIMQWLYENNIGHKLAWYSNAANSLFEMDIKSQEDRIVAIQQIEDSDFYQEPKALSIILKGIQERSYSNIFYITSALTYEVANTLTELNLFGKLNVISIQDGTEQLEEPIVKLFHEQNVHCIVIDENNLQQQLQSIIA